MEAHTCCPPTARTERVGFVFPVSWALRSCDYLLVSWALEKIKTFARPMLAAGTSKSQYSPVWRPCGDGTHLLAADCEDSQQRGRERELGSCTFSSCQGPCGQRAERYTREAKTPGRIEGSHGRIHMGGYTRSTQACSPPTARTARSDDESARPTPASIAAA